MNNSGMFLIDENGEVDTIACQQEAEEILALATKAAQGCVDDRLSFYGLNHSFYEMIPLCDMEYLVETLTESLIYAVEREIQLM